MAAAGLFSPSSVFSSGVAAMARRPVAASSSAPLQSGVSFAESSARMARSSEAQGGRPSMAAPGQELVVLVATAVAGPSAAGGGVLVGRCALDMRGGGDVSQRHCCSPCRSGRSSDPVLRGLDVPFGAAAGHLGLHRRLRWSRRQRLWLRQQIRLAPGA